MDIYEKENPLGIIVSMGGQIPNNLALLLHNAGVSVLGTSPLDIDHAEDRHKFSQLLDKLNVDQPKWEELTSLQEAEKFADKEAEKANSSSVIRVAGLDFAGKKANPLGNVRFRVVMSGVASDSSDVAALICRLEDSPYFCQVIPSFSRNRKIKADKDAGAGDLQVSEFEISCDLANYRYEDEGVGSRSQKG